MPKPKLERVTGVVALSYLLLIPAAAYLAWRRLEMIDRDVATMWEELKLPTDETRSNINLNTLKRMLRG